MQNPSPRLMQPILSFAKSQPTIVFTSDRSVALSGIGSTYQFAAKVTNMRRQPKFIWQSSDPKVVSIDVAGVATARQTRGSVTIIASARGVDSQSGSAIIAHPRPGTVLLSSNEVLRNGRKRVVLVRDKTTSAVQPGDILLSGNAAGVLARVVSVEKRTKTVIVETNSTSLARA